jgi:hypothetical protein
VGSKKDPDKELADHETAQQQNKPGRETPEKSSDRSHELSSLSCARIGSTAATGSSILWTMKILP